MAGSCEESNKSLHLYKGQEMSLPEELLTHSQEMKLIMSMKF
jgi:hypothetical protein